MRYRLLASYQGAPYEAGLGPDETGVVLFAACPPPEDLRFEPATGHWRKKVSRAEVQMLYQSRPVGTFRGEPCVVLDDLTDRLHIAYLGHDAYRAEQLGYWEVDRGVFELITPRHEVTDIVEQRLPLPLRTDSGSHPRPSPDALGQATGRDHAPQMQNGLPSFPHDQMPAGPAAQEPDQASPARQSQGSFPVVDQPPLPLEAEAMRAATAAARRSKKNPKHVAVGSRSEAPAGVPEAAPVPAIPVTPAGISEPSGAVHQGTDAASTVPSWTPQAHASPQRQAQAETARQADGPSLPAAPAPAETAPPGGAPPHPPAPPQVEAAPHADVSPLATAPATAETARRAVAAPLPSSSPPQADTRSPTRLPADPHPPGQARAALLPIESAPIHGVPLPPPADTARQSPVPSQGQHSAAGPVAVDQAAIDQATVDQATVDQATVHQATVHQATVHQATVHQATVHQATVDQAAATGTAPDLRQPQADPAGPEPKRATEGASPEAETMAAMAAGAPSGSALPAAYPPDQPESPVAAAALGGAPPALDGSSPDAASAQPARDGHREPAPLISHQPEADGQAVPCPSAPDHHLANAQPAARPDGLAIAPADALAAAPLDALAAVPAQGLAAAPAGGLAAVPAQGLSAAPADALTAVPAQVQPDDLPAPGTGAQPAPRRHRAARRRLPTQRIFSELASQAGIPADAYAIGEDVDGAMCLVQTGEGFEVFNSAGGARHEVRVFQDEESAYFYLFGVLVAEAVRTGALVPR